VRIVDRDGDEACIGRSVLVEDFAIFDRIKTQPNHRRRGLASAVMNTLQALSGKAGAGQGVLVATEAGRQLYENLAWRLYSPYTTAVIEGGVPKQR